MDVEKLQKIYNEDFYLDTQDESYLAGFKFLSFMRDIFPNVKSVIDVGCGIGTWLKAFKDVTNHAPPPPAPNDIEVFGLDVNIVDTAKLLIDRNNIKIVDLTKVNFSDVGRKFDMAMSLEVAEHLDKEAADNFIKLLTDLADIVLFSAASQFQLGTHHVNCQPPSYWSNKFKNLGFSCFDIIRPKFWENDEIPHWYRQNTLCYVKKDSVQYQKLISMGFNPCEKANSYFHLGTIQMVTFTWEKKCERKNNLLKGLIERSFKFKLKALIIRIICSFIFIKKWRTRIRKKWMEKLDEKIKKTYNALVQ